MMNARRFLVVMVVAGIAAAFVMLYPRIGADPEVSFPPLIAEKVQEAVDEETAVPWPSPPSASPLTSAPPPVIQEPGEERAAAVFREVNDRRRSAGSANLVLDETLTAVAQLHAADMARRSYFSHTTPEGVTFEMRMNASGYSYITAAENLGFASHVDLIVPDWMRSPPHRANIEDERMQRIGVATASGVWQGIDVVYAVAVFAVPR